MHRSIIFLAQQPTMTESFSFCPHCATALKPFKDAMRLRYRCPSCGWVHYRNPTVGVAVILVTHEGLWLGRRRSGGWCIPCGHVEWDEEVEDAALREMREEMGLDLELEGVFAVSSNFHDPDRHTVGVWYRATACDTTSARAGGDLLEIRPFPLDGLPELIFPTDRAVINRLRAERQ